MFNLSIVGNPIYMISQDKEFRCYYPENISFPLQPNEDICFIENNRVFIEAWIEEGWDNENDCIS